MLSIYVNSHCIFFSENQYDYLEIKITRDLARVCVLFFACSSRLTHIFLFFKLFLTMEFRRLSLGRPLRTKEPIRVNKHADLKRFVNLEKSNECGNVYYWRRETSLAFIQTSVEQVAYHVDSS